MYTIQNDRPRNNCPQLQHRIITPGKLPEIPIWFPDARLNFAENLLYRRDDGIAITEANENGIVAHVTFRQLHERVRAMAAALRAHGLKLGDRVAGMHT
jgi:acetoacetyl-CoA synthetase